MTTKAAYHRHDISDKVWALLEPHLPGRRSSWGRVAKDNRQYQVEEPDYEWLMIDASYI